MTTPKTAFAFLPALALAAMVPLASAAQAGENSDDIVVTVKSELAQWQADTGRALDRALARNPFERTSKPGSGVVQVTFTLGADGKPTDIALYDSSADFTAERSAMRAVRRLGDLSDVPVRNAQGAQFLANIVFADSVAEHDALIASLEQSERARLASGTVESTYIALGG
ncbi:TonB family protein [Qipengyuania nanhaisediminis]|uniref:TonB family protein n=1 Tax=Qipengyuania nanhaisediminis TaxID=604088 RepID=UPI0038B3FA7E